MRIVVYRRPAVVHKNPPSRQARVWNNSFERVSVLHRCYVHVILSPDLDPLLALKVQEHKKCCKSHDSHHDPEIPGVPIMGI